MIGLLTISLVIMGTFIHFKLDDIRVELKYRNTLMEEQNEILKQNGK
jgi:hypothetical protein